jgi:hypothetical protein
MTLPAAIQSYLDRRAGDSPETAVELFSLDGVVLDEGNTYRGPEQIAAWITASSSAFEYTVTFLGSETADDGAVVVTNRLEGNFPGGLVDLRFRFVLDDQGAIEHLTIAP